MAFFASPAKGWLIRRLNERNRLRRDALLQRGEVEREGEKEEREGGKEERDEKKGEEEGIVLMGLPSDPGGDIDEAVREIRDEVEARRRKGGDDDDGGRVGMSTGVDMKVAVEGKLGRKL